MTKLFILVHPGKAERSMYAGEYKTKFYKSGKGKHIRPHLIEEIEAMEYDGVHYSVLSLSTGGSLIVEETANKVLEMIEAIECCTVGESLKPLECEHVVLTNQNGNSYCPNCGKEWH